MCVVQQPKVFIRYGMSVDNDNDERGHGQTNQVRDINWDAIDHASQLMSSSY